MRYSSSDDVAFTFILIKFTSEIKDNELATRHLLQHTSEMIFKISLSIFDFADLFSHFSNDDQ